MWSRWSNTSRGSTATACPSPSLLPSPSFSFKDIQSLLNEDTEHYNTNAASTPRRSAVFHRVRAASSALRAWRSLLNNNKGSNSNKEEDKRIVIYYTSLRVVRKTFEDCRAVRSILRGFRVAVDERDLSMDSSFLDELNLLLGGGRNLQLSLPRVFVGGNYLGGADEIRQMHESGELKQIIEGAPPANLDACETCGGARFVLCSTCSGSHKRFSDKGGYRSCNACNENGLLRCAQCCPPIY